VQGIVCIFKSRVYEFEAKICDFKGGRLVDNLNELLVLLEKNWRYISWLVAGTFLYGLKKNVEIFDWFGYRRLAKLKNIESYTESSKLKNFLKRLKEEEAFRAATKIHAEGRLEKMISLIESGRGKLNLFTIRRAQKFFTHDSTEVNIRGFTRWDQVEAWGSVALGTVIYAGAAWLFIEISYSSSKQLVAKAITKPESITLTLGAFVFLVFAWIIAILVIQPSVSYSAAKKVKNHLAKETEKCLNAPT
jgi:hypothetical protein